MLRTSAGSRGPCVRLRDVDDARERQWFGSNSCSISSATAFSSSSKTMLSVLSTLHSETQRRNLPGPLGPIEEVIDEILHAIDVSDLPEHDRRRIHATMSAYEPSDRI